MSSRKRIQKELDDFNKNPTNNCSIIQRDEEDIFNLFVIIIGPEFTPYENGIFYLSYVYPTDYPFKPPHITFETKIYHPNINSNGSISLDILQDQWSPALTLGKILLSICSLLGEPNADDPLNLEIAKLYKSNKYEYYKKVREYSEKYADAPKDAYFYYLDGENRIDYELNHIKYSNDFSIFKNNKFKWQALINYKKTIINDVDHSKDIYIDEKIFLEIDFPQNYPWHPPELTFNSNFRENILKDINNKLKSLWNIRCLIKDVLDWVYRCIDNNKLAEYLYIKNVSEERETILLKCLIKEKHKNYLLQQKLNLENSEQNIKQDRNEKFNKEIFSEKPINVELKKSINENIDIESKIRLLNKYDLNKVINNTIGIINLENTCYISSCLQILIHCRLFISKLFELINLCHVNTPFTNLFLYICCQIKNDVDKIDISLLKDLFGSKYTIFKGHRQNDSQEFCRKLLENINTELNEAGNISPYKDLSNSFSKPKLFRYQIFLEYLRDREKSIITDLFYFITSKTLKCECGCENYPFEQLLDIPLLIPEDTEYNSISNLLKNYFKNESIEKFCEKCKKKAKNLQTIKIAEPPEILNLSIQRIKNDEEKNESLIEFPEILDLSEFIDNDLEYNGETMYYLYGIINHVGSLEFGHYYSYVKINNQNWYEFNDTVVQSKKSIDCKSSTVYSLFYLKVSSSQ